MKTTISALVLAVAASMATATARNDDQNAYEWLSTTDRYSTFAELVDMAGMKDQWHDANASYTIFAPTNDAFKKVPSDKLDALKNDPEKLKMLVKYHMVTGAKYGLRDLRTMHSLSMTRRADGRAAMVSLSEEGAFVTINGARIVDPEHWTNKGVVHGIDRVLMPMGW